MSKHEEQLYDELSDTQFDIIDAVDSLANVEWDSPTYKKKLEELLKQYWQTSKALDDLTEKDKVRN